jgi:hypothetical protein
MTNQFTPRAFTTFRLAALFLITAGYGWAGGHFIPANAPFWAYLFQFAVLLILLTFAIGFLRPAARWSTRGLTIFAALTLLINAANIIRGATNSGSFGSHNSFADLVPIGLIIFGDALWLLTILQTKPHIPKKTVEN